MSSVRWEVVLTKASPKVKPVSGIIAYVNILVPDVFRSSRCRQVSRYAAKVPNANKVRLLGVFIGFFVPALTGYCTSIVLLRDGASVVLGADTFVQPLNRALPERYQCKIHQVGKHRFVAFAGFADGALDDPLLIAKRFSDKSLADTVSGFETAVANQMKRTIQAVVQNPEFALKAEPWIGGKRSWITAVFVEFNGRTTEIAATEIFIKDPRGSVGLRSEHLTCPGGCNAPGTYVQFATAKVSAAEAKAIVDRSLSTQDAVAEIIGIECDRSPQSARRPINVLILEPTKAYWKLGNSEPCDTIY